MSQSELSMKLPCSAQRELQRHELVQELMHLVWLKWESVLQRVAPELRV